MFTFVIITQFTFQHLVKKWKNCLKLYTSLLKLSFQICVSFLKFKNRVILPKPVYYNEIIKSVEKLLCLFYPVIIRHFPSVTENSATQTILISIS